MSEEIEEYPDFEEKSYKVEFRGISGKFDLKNKITIEYLQTAIDINKLKHIEPVRRVFKRGELSFDLLLQREIDNDRINDDLIPYLLDNPISFFPPIIVVILEIKEDDNKKNINKFYDAPEEYEAEINKSKFDRREFGDLFTIDILKRNTKLQNWLSELRIGHNTTLLAIDGQHRLVALQAILGHLPEEEKHFYPKLSEYSNYRDKLKDLKIPVTFMYLPEIYKENEDCHTDLLEVFRTVFVDVNRNARQVSEIRNILVDEHDLRSVFTRQICSEIQKDQIVNNFTKYNSISLDEIEWEKENKEKQLSNYFAITNVMFIQNLLSNWLGDIKKDTFKYVLNLNSIASNLEDEDFPYEEMKLDKFSHKQKKEVVTLFENNFVSVFINLFASLPHVLKRTEFIKSMKQELLDRIQNSTTHDRRVAIKLHKYFFEGEEYKSILKEDSDKQLLQEEYKIYKEKLEELDKEYSLDIVRTKMFQEGYFKAVLNIVEDGYIEVDNLCNYSLKIRDITSSNTFTSLWKEIFIDRAKTLADGMRGKSGYSASNPLIEQIRKIIWIMITKCIKDEIIEEKQESSKILKSKYIDEIKDMLSDKYKRSLPDTYSEEERDASIGKYGVKTDELLGFLRN